MALSPASAAKMATAEDISRRPSPSKSTHDRALCGIRCSSAASGNNECDRCFRTACAVCSAALDPNDIPAFQPGDHTAGSCSPDTSSHTSAVEWSDTKNKYLRVWRLK